MRAKEAILALLDDDIERHPERLQALSQSLIDRISALVKHVETRRNARLPDDDLGN
jgi:hypothetical protein